MRIAGIERARSLWHMIVGPTIWAVHFCLTYGIAATVCARTDIGMPVLRLSLLAVSGVAVALIGAAAWLAWRQWDYRDDYDYDHAGNSAEDRREFLGHVGFLLCVISLIGVVYGALPVLFAGSCR